MNSVIGTYCPYCQKILTEQDSVLVCQKCHTPHHHQCWVENQGCAVAGCEGSLTHAGAVESEAPRSKQCPNCGEAIPAAAVFCVHCKTMLQDLKSDSNGSLPAFATLIDAVKFGWNRTIQNLGFLILMQLGLVAGGLVLAFVSSLTIYFIPAGVLFSIGIFLFSSLVTVGVQRVFLKIADNHPVSWADIFSASDRLLPFIGVGLLVGFGTAVGFFFFLIPGLIFAFFTMLAPIIVVDQPLGAVEAIKTSMALVLDNILLTFLLWLAVTVLGMLGALFFSLGLLFTAPISALTLIYGYRKMLYKNQ